MSKTPDSYWKDASKVTKRAVTFSYALVRDFISGNSRIEHFEVTNGIPKDAVLVEMFPHPESGGISLIFESESWQGETMEVWVIAPKSGKVWEHPYCVQRFIQSELSDGDE